MNIRFDSCYVILKISLGIFLTSCNSSESVKMNLAVAANMRFALEEIKTEFEKVHDVECNLIVSSSGTLTAQIREGAPYDVFFSADMRYPQHLFELGLTDSPPTIYAIGKLVYWSKKEIELNEITATVSETTKIAIANPDIAPYGKATMQVLMNLFANNDFQENLIIAENVSQVNQFIKTGAVDLAFTAKSSQVQMESEVGGFWGEIDLEYTPIAQGYVILNSNRASQEIVKDFEEFFRSKLVKEILHRHGYTLPES